MQVAPCTISAAKRQVKEWHRHLPALQGGLFAVSVVDGRGKCLGVGVFGNPPRVWQGTGRGVITRCAAQENLPRVGKHASPACTMIYGALCRAAKALGYREAWTYTLPEEPGTSLRAAGFMDMGMTAGGEWDTPSRPRKAAVRPEPKRRWLRRLSQELKPDVTKSENVSTVHDTIHSRAIDLDVDATDRGLERKHINNDRRCAVHSDSSSVVVSPRPFIVNLAAVRAEIATERAIQALQARLRA